MQPNQPAVPGLTGETARRWAAVQPASGDARILIGDTPGRAELIAGLRLLANYLAANPSVPVPAHRWKVTVDAEGTDSEQFSQVDLVAEVMGERPVDRRAATGHHHVERSFGPVIYEFSAIAGWRMAQHRDRMSYADSVVLDSPARLAAEAFPATAQAAAHASEPPRMASGPRAPRTARRAGMTP
jgi:hypothetical protein